MADFNITLEELAPYCKGFTKEQLDQARQICLTYRLNPVRRQIHIQKRWTKTGDVISPLVTIDGLRGIAERSDKYEGQVGPFWCGHDGKWADVWLEDKPPLAAKVGVHKKGFRDALYAVAKFEEFKQLFTNKDTKKEELTGLWQKMPDLMIAKCAEALALRRAFPDELDGLYTEEEMHQAEPTKDEKIARSFSMVSDDDQPVSPFSTSEDRKAWMLSAKEDLDAVEDEDQLDVWLKDNGPNMTFLGTYQLSAMNKLIAEKKAQLGEAAMDNGGRR